MSLQIIGVIDATLPGGQPKALEFYAFEDIADLSVYSLDVFSNGNTTASNTVSFDSVALEAGDFYYVTGDAADFETWFGFAADEEDGAASFNGDDAFQLARDGEVVDSFGEVGVDGTGQVWEYTDGWAYRLDGTGPDLSAFLAGDWTFSGPDALDGAGTNDAADPAFPDGSYTAGVLLEVIAAEDFDGGDVNLIEGFDPVEDNLDGGGGDFFGVGSQSAWPQAEGVPFSIADDSVVDYSGSGVSGGDIEGILGQNSDFENAYFAASDTRDFIEIVDGQPVPADARWSFDISGATDLVFSVDVGSVANGDSFGGYSETTFFSFVFDVDGVVVPAIDFLVVDGDDVGDFTFRPMDSGADIPTNTALQGVNPFTEVTKFDAATGEVADNTFLDRSPADGAGAGQLDTFQVTLANFDGTPLTGETLTVIAVADVPFEALVFDNIEILGTSGQVEPEAGVSFLETDGTTEVVEGGEADTVGVVLDARPTADVDIALTSTSASVEVTPGFLTFTPDNWDVPQVVEVLAFEDSIDDDGRLVDIDVAITSLDGDYDGLTPDFDVQVFDAEVVNEVLISEVQGDGAASPLEGQLVTVEAVVTAVFADELEGFFLQEEASDSDGDAATSEGIFVFAPEFADEVAEGDLVSVTGTVGEFFDSTQIGFVTAVEVLDEDLFDEVEAAEIALPVPEDVVSREEIYEPVEGMLVTFTTPLTVTQLFNYERFGRVELAPNDRVFQYTQTNEPDADGFADFQARDELNRVILDDGSDDQNPDGLPFLGVEEFGGGDVIEELTGVVSYRFGEYQIVESDSAPVEVENATPRPDAPEDVGGSLTVASFNVLNYFTTLDTPENAGAVNGLDPRGANSAAEFEIQNDKIVAAIDALDADIVGLIEIENDDGAALQTLTDELNEVSDRTYAAAFAGRTGTDAIKVAIIYDTETVEIAEGTEVAVLDTEDFVGPVSTILDPNDLLDFDPKNRPAVAVTFEEIASGEQVTVVNNHFKSKGSPVEGEDVDVDDGLTPDTLLSGEDLGSIDGEQPVVGVVDGQGSGSATRQSAADQLVDWLATNPTGTTDSDILIIGDLNAYAAEPAIGEIEEGADDEVGTDDDYTNLIEEFVGDEAYSFRFSGQWGYLDHALANSSLEGQVTGVTEWRINADEPAYLDFNDNVLDPIERSFEQKPDALFDEVDATSPARSSDHDPVIVGLDLGSDPVSDTFTLELLHVTDQEGSSANITDILNTSGILNALEAQDLGDDGIADNTVRLSSGDAILPGAFFDLSDDVFGAAGIADIQIQNELGFDAIALGNHEFDFGTRTLAELIDGREILDIEDDEGNTIGQEFGGPIGDFSALEGSTLEDLDFTGTDFPYLSTNLDFSGDSNLAPLEVDGGQAPQGNVVTSSTVIDVNGEPLGVVGATTPTLAAISSPGGVGIAPSPFGATPTDEELDALAAEIQFEVDALLAANPDLNKVILLAHMQQITIEFGLAERLEGVDIIVAGGSNQRLFDENDRVRDGDTPSEEGDPAGVYPQEITNAGGTTTLVVNTDGFYKYVGRLVVDFDADGNIIPESYDADVSGAYATDDQGLAEVGGEELVDQEVAEILEAMEEQIEALEGNVFGVAENFLLRDSGAGITANDGLGGERTQETALGNLTADANLAYAEDLTGEDIQISIKNGGGIRAPIGETVVPPGGTEAQQVPNQEILDPEGNVIKPEGGISQFDIGSTLSFNNELVLLTLTAEEIVGLLEHGIDAIPGVSGRFPQISGLKFSYDDTAASGEKVINAGIFDGDELVAELVRDGEIVEPEATYRVVSLEFLTRPRFDEDGNYTGNADGYTFPNYNTDALNEFDGDREGLEVGDPDIIERLDLTFLNSPADGDDSSDFTEEDSAANFAATGTEQDALAEYLNDNFNPFSGEGEALGLADTPVELDERIQNVNFREDTVLPDGDDFDFVFEGSDGNDRATDTEGDDLFVTNGGRRDIITLENGGDDVVRVGEQLIDDVRERVTITAQQDFTLEVLDGVDFEVNQRGSTVYVEFESGTGVNDIVQIRGGVVTAEGVVIETFAGDQVA